MRRPKIEPVRFVRYAAISAAVLLVACGGEAQQGGGFQMPPMPVETALVKKETVSERFSAVGTIEADAAVTIVSEIDGVIEALPFEEGGAIEGRAEIALLDDAQLKAEVTRAEALVVQQQATFSRVEEVVAQGAASAQDLDDASANLKVASANLAVARTRRSKTRILAPFAGLVGSRLVSPGAFVRAGQAITSLASIDDLRIHFSVPERFLSQLLPGAAVSVTTPAYPDRELTGVVSVIEPVLDADTRTARVIARAKNSGRLIRPGMSANVSVILAERPNALTLQVEAVFAKGSQSFVYTIGPDSTVAMAPVALGTRLRDRVEVLDGLQAGDRVVSAGHQKLFPGAKVLPVSSAP